MHLRLWKSRLHRLLHRKGFLGPEAFPYLDNVDFLAGQRRTDFARRRRVFLEKKNPKILYYVHWAGGVGGLERSTGAFVHGFQKRGCEIDVVCEVKMLSGINSFERLPGVRTFLMEDFKKERAFPEYDLFYSQPVGRFDDCFWTEFFSKFNGIKVLNWQRSVPYWLELRRFDFDLIHCESTQSRGIPPFVFLSPPPASVLPLSRETGEPSRPFPRYHLTVFNPHGKIKGVAFLREALDRLDRPLVWCFDPGSFAGEPERMRYMEEEISNLVHPLLFKVEAPTQEYLHRLYRDCDGYMCFSDYESYGWAIRDAIHHQKPVAGRHVGFLREVKNYRPWNGKGAPLFNRISGTVHSGDFIEDLRGHLSGRSLKSSCHLKAQQMYFN